MNGITDDYIKERNEAMLAYPDTSKISLLLVKYPFLFPDTFKLLWAQSSPETKIRTLEKMILNWSEAPISLIKKVKDAEYKRIMRGFV